MSDTLLSVIIPVYNAAPYLRRCLDSVIAQTYKNIEIICINDGSTDDSGSILEEYGRRDSRVRVIFQNHAGLVRGRKNGVSAAKGTYVMYVDADDWIDENMAEEMLFLAESQDADLVCLLFGRRFIAPSV